MRRIYDYMASCPRCWAVVSIHPKDDKNLIARHYPLDKNKKRVGIDHCVGTGEHVPDSEVTVVRL